MDNGQFVKQTKLTARANPPGGARGCLGQGMIEYLLVLTVVISTSVVVMNTISSSTQALINSMVNNIQQVTNVTSP